MPLRMIEIYTDAKMYADASSDVVYAVVQHLVRHGECQWLSGLSITDCQCYFASVVNSQLVVDPTIRQPGFDLPR